MKAGMHVALPEYAKEFGPICKIFFGRYPIVLISDPELVKEVHTFPSFHDGDWHDTPRCWQVMLCTAAASCCQLQHACTARTTHTTTASRVQVCVSKFMAFHDRQYNMGHVGGTDDEANCTMKYGMLSAR